MIEDNIHIAQPKGFSIPVTLLQHVMKEKLIGEFRFLLCMKLVSNSGRIKRGTKEWKDAFALSGVSRPTRNKYVAKLKHLNWIGENSNGVIYLRGWSNLMIQLQLKGKRYIPFSTSDLEKFRIFCFAVVVGDTANRTQKHLNHLKKGANKREALEIQHRKDKVGVSVYGMSQLTGIDSTSELVALKKEAAREGYLSFNKQLEVIYTPTYEDEDISIDDILESMQMDEVYRCFSAPVTVEKRDRRFGIVLDSKVKRQLIKRLQDRTEVVGLNFKKEKIMREKLNNTIQWLRNLTKKQVKGLMMVSVFILTIGVIIPLIAGGLKALFFWWLIIGISVGFGYMFGTGFDWLVTKEGATNE